MIRLVCVRVQRQLVPKAQLKGSRCHGNRGLVCQLWRIIRPLLAVGPLYLIQRRRRMGKTHKIVQVLVPLRTAAVA